MRRERPICVAVAYQEVRKIIWGSKLIANLTNTNVFVNPNAGSMVRAYARVFLKAEAG